MSLPYETALRLFRHGRFREIVDGDTGNLTPSGATPEHRLLLAQTLFYTGRLGAAKALLDKEVNSAPRVTSWRSTILGLMAKQAGEVETATRHFKEAIQSASHAKDIVLEAWAKLHFFRLLAESKADQDLSRMMQDLRYTVTSAADPHLVVYLHTCVAIIETQKGHFDEARRHLSTGTSLLERHPNLWLEQGVEVAATSLACLQLDFASAAKHSANARQLGRATGHDTASTALELNEAYAQLWLGRIASAHSKLTALRDIKTAAGRLSALETLARLYLCLGRLEDCQETLETIATLSADQKLTSLYPVRWASVARAKLCMKLKLPQRALDEAMVAHQHAVAIDDTHLSGALALVVAEASAALCQARDAGRGLLAACEANVLMHSELQGHYYLTCARVLEYVGSDLCAIALARAKRIWVNCGNVGSIVEASSLGQGPLPISNYDKQVSLGHTTSIEFDANEFRSNPAAAIDLVASALELSKAPSLLADELKRLILVLDCESFARVEEKRGSAESPALGPGAYSIALGTDRGRTFTLVYREADDPVKSIVIADLARITRAALSLVRLRREEQARTALWPVSDDEESGTVYVDEQMVSLVRAAKRVAPVNVSVLITGETGTGKEVLARTIHAASARAQSTFLPFNCSACPRDIVDAQLFGHRRGAFTGALEHSPGVIRSAAGGTLFLDEIGDAPLDVQPKLLRFLESGDIHPIGETLPVHVDVRVIAATNADLDAMVSAGRFRDDLFYRLNIVRLHIPPLRERRVEIPVLAQHYLQQYAREYDKGHLRLAEDTVEYLLLYKWPGNVRQLANEIRRLAALAERDAVLMPEHLAPDIAASRRTVPPSEREIEPHEVVVRIDQPMAAAVEHLERTMVLHALKACNGRVEETARRLGMSRKGLYLKRQRFGLDVQDQVRSA